LLKPFFPEFGYIYDANVKRRMQRRRKVAEEQRKKLASATDLVALIAAQAEEDNDADDNPGWNHGDEDVQEPEHNTGASDAEYGHADDDDANSVISGNTHDPVLQSEAQDAAHDLVYVATYEDLCRSHIARLLAKQFAMP
jgi:hypothetical protein